MLNKEILKKIKKRIEEDTEYEIDMIKKELFYFLNKNLDMYFLKEFIKHYPAKLIKEKSELLLDTLLNYLMKEVIESLVKQSEEVQYFFSRENLREKVRDWALDSSNRYIPSILKIREKEGLAQKTLIVAPGIAVSAGGLLATVVIPETGIIKAIPAVSTLAGPIYIFKKLKEKNRRIKRMWKKDIEKYLKDAERGLKGWLLKVCDKFEKELEEVLRKINLTLRETKVS